MVTKNAVNPPAHGARAGNRLAAEMPVKKTVFLLFYRRTKMEFANSVTPVFKVLFSISPLI